MGKVSPGRSDARYGPALLAGRVPATAHGRNRQLELVRGTDHQRHSDFG
jgi:hypothetical protein